MQDRIKVIRNALGMNQRDFSAQTKIGHSTLAMFETGQRTPKSIHIAQICQAFNVNERWLRYGEEPMILPRTSSNLLADVIAKNNLEGYVRTIIEGYYFLSEDQRRAIRDYISTVTAEIKTAAPEEVAKEPERPVFYAVAREGGTVSGAASEEAIRLARKLREEVLEHPDYVD